MSLASELRLAQLMMSTWPRVVSNAGDGVLESGSHETGETGDQLWTESTSGDKSTSPRNLIEAHSAFGSDKPYPSLVASSRPKWIPVNVGTLGDSYPILAYSALENTLNAYTSGFSCG